MEKKINPLKINAINKTATTNLLCNRVTTLSQPIERVVYLALTHFRSQLSQVVRILAIELIRLAPQQQHVMLLHLCALAFVPQALWFIC